MSLECTIESGEYVDIAPEPLKTLVAGTVANVFTYGVKPIRSTGWIAGKHSKVTVDTEVDKRHFLMKLPEGLSPTSRYVLWKFETKSDRREVELGKIRYSAHFGVTSIPYKYEKLDKGVFMITLSDLDSGEYAFSWVGNVYSFRVVSSRPSSLPMTEREASRKAMGYPPND